MVRLAFFAFIVLLWPIGAMALDTSLRFGENKIQSELDGVVLDVFTYRPLECAKPSVLLVFHGNGRGASSYRDSARSIADRACFVVYSPLMDKKRFPNWSYHRGGVVHKGTLREREDWTVTMVQDLIDWIKLREGDESEIYLFGHSAGAQFLSRVAAYGELEGVERIVLANPSTYVLPNNGEAAPYGFGGLPEDISGPAAIQAYLAAPVTVYLGLEDKGEKDLTRNDQADKQGSNRLERGRNVYQLARDTAAQFGWPFGWSMVEVPGVGHTARGMLRAREFTQALGLVPVQP